MSRLRKVVAERAVVSMQTMAQLTTVVEVDVTQVAAAPRRGEGASSWRRPARSSPSCRSSRWPPPRRCAAYPIINATVDGDTIVYPDHENISIAVDTERGLLTPVIRDAGDLDLAGLAAQIADLAERTRDNKLKPDELAGGTFTLTNTGSRGALFDTPVVFLPQVAILGTGIVVEEAGRRERLAASTRSPSARRCTSRCRTTTASSTAPTPPASSPRSRTASRAATSRRASASSRSATQSRIRQPASPFTSRSEAGCRLRPQLDERRVAQPLDDAHARRPPPRAAVAALPRRASRASAAGRRRGRRSPPGRRPRGRAATARGSSVSRASEQGRRRHRRGRPRRPPRRTPSARGDVGVRGDGRRIRRPRTDVRSARRDDRQQHRRPSRRPHRRR